MLRCVLLASVLAARGVVGSDFNLRGSLGAGPSTPMVNSSSESAARQRQRIECSCTSAGDCRCDHPVAPGAESEEGDVWEQTLLNETNEQPTRWQSQHATTQQVQWLSFPLLDAETEDETKQDEDAEEGEANE